MPRNIDPRVVADFGDEWSRFDQSAVSDAEQRSNFEKYFRDFPWASLPTAAIGADFGCGSGRWGQLAAERVGHLHCVDASSGALAVARRNLAGRSNVTFHEASIDRLPLADASLDFGYSLGVLHHMPDTTAALASCVSKLKPGAPFLLYLYYRFDNRPRWFRGLWRASDVARPGHLRSPTPHKHPLFVAIST
jgi:SAM-dependent methyltransferase